MLHPHLRRPLEAEKFALCTHYTIRAEKALIKLKWHHYEREAQLAIVGVHDAHGHLLISPEEVTEAFASYNESLYIGY